jgi:hypothetical protein
MGYSKIMREEKFIKDIVGYCPFCDEEHEMQIYETRSIEHPWQSIEIRPFEIVTRTFCEGEYEGFFTEEQMRENHRRRKESNCREKIKEEYRINNHPFPGAIG